MTTARYYHAGCPVCISAEHTLLGLLAPSVQVEIVHPSAWPKPNPPASRRCPPWWSMVRCCT